jgi:nitrate/nitrite transporter NarK
MLCIMFMFSDLGILVNMFFMSNEHILVFLSISMVSSSVIRVLESCMLYVYGSCRWLCSSFAMCFASSYAGAFFELIMGLHI